MHACETNENDAEGPQVNLACGKGVDWHKQTTWAVRHSVECYCWCNNEGDRLRATQNLYSCVRLLQGASQRHRHSSVFVVCYVSGFRSRLYIPNSESGNIGQRPERTSSPSLAYRFWFIIMSKRSPPGKYSMTMNVKWACSKLREQ